MADRARTSKGKSDTPEEGVLASLPATRPSRLSRRARESGVEESGAPATGQTAKPAAGAPAKRATTPKTARARKPAAAKVAGRKAATGAAAAGKAAPPRPEGARGPTPIRPSSPALARKQATERKPDAEDVPPRQQNPVELATTVVKAAGELAQIVGGQVIKRVTDKLPKP